MRCIDTPRRLPERSQERSPEQSKWWWVLRGGPPRTNSMESQSQANLSDGWDDIEAVPVVCFLERLDRDVTEL